MKKMNFKKYKPYEVVEMNNRKWPSQSIHAAPIWCSVDLRDGNQALNIPMNIHEKVRLFELLVQCGFKEIEVGFPSASETEFAFLRKLIDEDRIPDDVSIQVLTQAREHLIKRTFESLEGVKNGIVHFYNSTSELQRRVVFKKDKKEILDIAVKGAKIIRSLAEDTDSNGIRFEYSPESFSGTEMDFAVDVCHGVMDVFEPTPENPIILNLPATVEMTTPNLYADQIEWFCDHLRNRESVLVSLHTHNDRGTSVAATELGLMAGADRVEGTLFGNGERTGNLDIVTVALNLFSQGVDPQLDFSDINKVRSIYSECTRMPVHPRHPYAGDLVYTAFSGSHQDAINKGFKARFEEEIPHWEIPYLPIDPQDVGRNYESVIRINSQSGKGGIAYILEQKYGLKIPKDMQYQFSNVIQKITDKSGKELTPEEIFETYKKTFWEQDNAYSLVSCDIEKHGEESKVIVEIKNSEGLVISFDSCGNGPIDAFVKGIIRELDLSFSLEHYSEHALNHGSDATAVAYICLKNDQGEMIWGSSMDSNISMASIKGLISAINRMG